MCIHIYIYLRSTLHVFPGVQEHQSPDFQRRGLFTRAQVQEHVEAYIHANSRTTCMYILEIAHSTE